MHATLEKFGYPRGCILESTHWALLIRPVQCTLGALVLCSKADVHSLPGMPPEAFAELRAMCRDLEHALSRAFAYEKINYLMLMMVDPQVHFHVLPRYSQGREFAGLAFADAGWPGPPDLTGGVALDEALASSLHSALREHLPSQGAAAKTDAASTQTR